MDSNRFPDDDMSLHVTDPVLRVFDVTDPATEHTLHDTMLADAVPVVVEVPALTVPAVVRFPPVTVPVTVALLKLPVLPVTVELAVTLVAVVLPLIVAVAALNVVALSVLVVSVFVTLTLAPNAALADTLSPVPALPHVTVPENEAPSASVNALCVILFAPTRQR